MLSDLDFIVICLKLASIMVWDLSAGILMMKAKNKSSVFNDLVLTPKEFQKIVKNFCFTAKDYHVVSQFFSTEWSIFLFTYKVLRTNILFHQIDLEDLLAVKTLSFSCW